MVCTASVHIFTIDRERFTRIVIREGSLVDKLINVVDDLIESPTQDKVCDYIMIRHVWPLPNGFYLHGEEA